MQNDKQHDINALPASHKRWIEDKIRETGGETIRATQVYISNSVIQNKTLGSSPVVPVHLIPNTWSDDFDDTSGMLGAYEYRSAYIENPVMSASGNELLLGCKAVYDDTEYIYAPPTTQDFIVRDADWEFIFAIGDITTDETLDGAGNFLGYAGCVLSSGTFANDEQIKFSTRRYIDVYYRRVSGGTHRIHVNHYGVHATSYVIASQPTSDNKLYIKLTWTDSTSTMGYYYRYGDTGDFTTLYEDTLSGTQRANYWDGAPELTPCFYVMPSTGSNGVTSSAKFSHASAFVSADALDENYYAFIPVAPVAEFTTNNIYIMLEGEGTYQEIQAQEGMLVRDYNSNNIYEYNGTEWVVVGSYHEKKHALDDTDHHMAPTAGFTEDDIVTFDASGMLQNGDYNVEEIRHQKTGWEEDIDDKTIQPTAVLNGGNVDITINTSSASYYYIQNQRFEFDGSDTVSIPDSDGVYFIYYNSSGVLTQSTTAWDLIDGDVCPCLLAYRDSVNGVTKIGYEFHKWTYGYTMHAHDHRTVGALYEDGLTVTNSGTQKVVVEDGKIWDEDIIIYIRDGAGSGIFEQVLDVAKLPIVYFEGASAKPIWVENPDDDEFVVFWDTGDKQVYWNEYTGGAWQLTKAANNKYSCMWVVCSNETKKPVFLLMGQAAPTNTAGEARDANYLQGGASPLNRASLQGAFKEFIIAYRLVAKNTATSYTLETIDTELDDFRSQSIGSGAGGAGTPTASDVSTDTSDFDNNLSSADTTVQKALDTLNGLGMQNIKTTANKFQIYQANGTGTMEAINNTRPIDDYDTILAFMKRSY